MINTIDLKNYIITKIDLELLKQSDLFSVNLKEYIEKFLEYQIKIKSTKFN